MSLPQPPRRRYYGAALLPGTTKLLIAMELMAASLADIVCGDGVAPPAPLGEPAIAYVLREVRGSGAWSGGSRWAVLAVVLICHPMLCAFRRPLVGSSAETCMPFFSGPRCSMHWSICTPSTASTETSRQPISWCRQLATSRRVQQAGGQINCGGGVWPLNRQRC